MEHSELMKILNNDEFEIVELSLSKNIKGLYADNVIAINRYLNTNAEKCCIVAEELGHYHTTVGNILDQSIIENRKQEYKARRWAVLRLIRVEQFIEAFKAGVRNKAELAEFLEVTESFIDMAVEHFKGIYGISHVMNEYIIYFEPLYIYKKL